MNYLREINAFERRMRRAPLSVNAQLLWYKLMQAANRLHWPEEFQIDNPRLRVILGQELSRQTMTAARAELIDDGLLAFIPGVRGKPSTYRMVSVDALEAPEPPAIPEEGDFLGEVREDITTYFGYTEALGREVKEIAETLWAEFLPGEKPTQADVRQVFFYIMEQTGQESGEVVMTFPEERKALLGYAFDQARRQRKVTWGYIEGIYRNFARRGIKTLEEAQEYEDNHGPPKGW